VDVSTYQPVVWVESEAEECSTVFVKKCEEKSENVCTDVTETKCEVSPEAGFPIIREVLLLHWLL
jgi:hypothetical protein